MNSPFSATVRRQRCRGAVALAMYGYTFWTLLLDSPPDFAANYELARRTGNK